MIMRNLIVFMYTGYNGSEGCDILVVDNHAPDSEIDGYAYGMAVQNAESYGYEIGSDCSEDGENYSEDRVEFEWYDYNPLIHDGHRAGGGSFADDFKGW
jgi:hypothetical protein